MQSETIICQKVLKHMNQERNKFILLLHLSCSTGNEGIHLSLRLHVSSKSFPGFCVYFYKCTSMRHLKIRYETKKGKEKVH